MTMGQISFLAAGICADESESSSHVILPNEIRYTEQVCNKNADGKVDRGSNS